VSKASELLPDPETPVNTTSFFFGMSSVTFLRFVLLRASDGDGVGLGHGGGRP